MKEGLRNEIAGRGFWRINFRPIRYGVAIPSLKVCRELVESSSVEKRGWDYPHIPVRNDDGGGIELHGSFVEGWCDWQNHREIWRMYKSGQYIHHLALREDWTVRDTWYSSAPNQQDAYPENKRVSALGLTWQIAEIFEFLSRIAKQGMYDSGVEVAVRLNDTAGRRLDSDPGRMPFFLPLVSSAASVEHRGIYSRSQIAYPRECAVAVSADLFDKFGWNPSEDQLRALQEELYALKMGRG